MSVVSTQHQCTSLAGYLSEHRMGLHLHNYVDNTAAVPASEGEAVVRSPMNMASTTIAAVDFKKMTSLTRPACWPDCGHVRWGRSASQSTASNASVVLIRRKQSCESLICLWWSITIGQDNNASHSDNQRSNTSNTTIDCDTLRHTNSLVMSCILVFPPGDFPAAIMACNAYQSNV